MNHNTKKYDNASYLDVSELIMKDYSPVFRPKPSAQPSEAVPNSQSLQEISPILEAKVHFPITPVFDRSKSEPMKQIYLDELDDFSLCGKSQNVRQKKTKKSLQRFSETYHIVDNDLENIIEECSNEEMEEIDSQPNQSQEVLQPNLDQQVQSLESQQNQNQGQKQSTNLDFVHYQFKNQEWQAPNPKKQLISKIKAIIAPTNNSEVQQKFSKIRQTILKYLCEHQKYYFEESMDFIQRTHSEIKQIVDYLIKGIEQTFRKIIGGLSFEKRRVKVLRYLDKKKRRVWRKKVNYDCRKKVADGRLRIKGKFVTHQQACEQLGFANLEGYSPQEIKQLLYKKIEQN